MGTGIMVNPQQLSYLHVLCNSATPGKVVSNILHCLYSKEELRTGISALGKGESGRGLPLPVLDAIKGRC